jgi:hypothetical protein
MWYFYPIWYYPIPHGSHGCYCDCCIIPLDLCSGSGGCDLHGCNLNCSGGGDDSGGAILAILLVVVIIIITLIILVGIFVGLIIFFILISQITYTRLKILDKRDKVYSNEVMDLDNN